MALVVQRITGPFGAEILGADLHRPPDRELVDTRMVYDALPRALKHRATKYDVFQYKRDLRRTTINEYGPEMASTDARNTAAQPAG